MRIAWVVLTVLLLLGGAPRGAEAGGAPSPQSDALLAAFRKRFAETDPADKAALFDLALWCRSRGLSKESRRVLEMVLAVDPEDEAANRALGRVRFEGRWMDRGKRREIIEERRAAAMRAAGLVSCEGAWVTPEEKKILQGGLVLSGGKRATSGVEKKAGGDLSGGGRWIPGKDISLLKEMEEFSGESGTTCSHLVSEHFAVFSEFGDDFDRKLDLSLEEGWTWFGGIFGVSSPAAGERLTGGRRILAAAFNDRESFEAFVGFFSGFQENMTAEWTQRARGVFGFAWWDPSCYTVAYKGVRKEEDLAGQILHQTGHILLNRMGYDYHYLPPWLDEGFACLFEYEITGANRASCIEGRNLVSAAASGDLFSGAGWVGTLDDLVLRGIDPDFEDLMVKEMDAMDQDDVAKAVGLVLFLFRDKPGSLPRLHSMLQRGLSRGKPDFGGAEALEVQLESVEGALSADPSQVDLAFRSWWKSHGRPGAEGRTKNGEGGEKR